MMDQIKLTEIVLRHLLIELPSTNKNYWSIAHAWSSVSLILLLKEKLKQELSTVVQEELQSLIELVESQTPLLEADFLKDFLCH